jgi:hypothetical protein
LVEHDLHRRKAEHGSLPRKPGVLTSSGFQPAKSGGRIGIDIGWTGEPEGSSSRILIETFKDDDVDPNLFRTSFFDVLPDPTIY